ncbi:MAG: alpha/beta fold hydrolase [Acetobacteraceae bacterium]|nr:alpha/beta fold hydrolase [Acetobacteraceae bacterium]
MSAATAAPQAGTTAPDIAARIQAEIDRALQRNIKGLEYIASPDPVMGITPKDVIHKRGTLNLYHYHPIADEVYRVPVLLVMAPTNRGYILDLAPGQSLVEFLLKRGYDVFMIDWTPPGPEEKHLGFEVYTQDFIPDCISRVMADSGESEVSLIGYCAGGMLSVMYAALNPNGPLKNLVCFTTPIDFTKMELFHNWSDKRFFDVDRVVTTFGVVPAEFTFTAFEMLRPAARVAGQVKLWDNMWNDQFVKSYRMFDRWSMDPLPLPGEYFRQTIKDLMWENRLCKGELVLGREKVDLSKIKVPFLHVVAEHDHIVPRGASKPLIDMVGSAEKREVMLKGGHVSVAAGTNAIKRLWPTLDTSLSERSV